MFSDESEVYIYNESDSEAGTSGAAPASIVESEDEDIPPWESLENELEAGNSICAAAQASTRKGDVHIPAMPCVANYKGEPHRLKTVPFNSHSRITMNACVARPVSRKELLQSPPAQASMKAEWDRLRNKIVWDEDKVRELPKRVITNSISVTCSVYVLRRTRSSLPFIRNGSLKGEWCFRVVSGLSRHQSKLGSCNLPRHGIMSRHDGSVEGGGFLWFRSGSCG